MRLDTFLAATACVRADGHPLNRPEDAGEVNSAHAHTPWSHKSRTKEPQNLLKIRLCDVRPGALRVIGRHPGRNLSNARARVRLERVSGESVNAGQEAQKRAHPESAALEHRTNASQVRRVPRRDLIQPVTGSRSREGSTVAYHMDT
jgi:hypothetical protein